MGSGASCYKFSQFNLKLRLSHLVGSAYKLITHVFLYFHLIMFAHTFFVNFSIISFFIQGCSVSTEVLHFKEILHKDLAKCIHFVLITRKINQYTKAISKILCVQFNKKIRHLSNKVFERCFKCFNVCEPKGVQKPVQ